MQRIIVLPPGGAPFALNVPAIDPAMLDRVLGESEGVDYNEDISTEVDFWFIDQEDAGHLLLVPNCLIGGTEPIYGTAAICGKDETSLTDEQVKRWLEAAHTWPRLAYQRGAA